MRLTVKFFASLRERMGRGEQVLQIDAPAISVAQLWAGHLSSEAMAPNMLIAVNQEYASAEQLVHDGDEVAFFPPVTGG